MKLYYPHEYKALIKLGIPITIGQIGLTMQNLADNIMVGRHSTEELAAAGFINNIFILALLLTVGFSIGAVSQIGANYARDNKPRIVTILKNSLFTNTLQALLIIIALVLLYFILPHIGQPDELIPLMRPYLVIQIASLPFMILSGTFRQFTDSINDTHIAMGIMLTGNIWNIVFNWLLIFGHCGFPEMGIIGAAWATFSSRVLILLLTITVFLLRPQYKTYVSLWHNVRINLQDMRLLNRLGWPIAIQMGLEVASFSLVTIPMGWLGTHALASHQVMLSVANLIFMFFLGIASAVAIRVSNHNGQGNQRGVRQAAFAGWEIILALCFIMSVVIVIQRHHISSLFTDSQEVAAIVGTMILPLILYQFGDCTQTVFSNALRGLGDVQKLMKYAFLAYIVVSIPISYFLGITLGWGAFGIWMGFPFGLSTAAVLYARRFLHVTHDEHLKHH